MSSTSSAPSKVKIYKWTTGTSELADGLLLQMSVNHMHYTSPSGSSLSDGSAEMRSKVVKLPQLNNYRIAATKALIDDLEKV